jgi:hypothetical protein
MDASVYLKPGLGRRQGELKGFRFRRLEVATKQYDLHPSRRRVSLSQPQITNCSSQNADYRPETRKKTKERLLIDSPAMRYQITFLAFLPALSSRQCQLNNIAMRTAFNSCQLCRGRVYSSSSSSSSL